VRRVIALFLFAVAGLPSVVRAQQLLPPSAGGSVSELGLPAIYKPYLGFANGLSRVQGDHLTT
jgi:hypothetical protein